MKRHRGICRTVYLIGPWAIKVPTTRPYGIRDARVWAWTRGVQANISERDWYRSCGDEVKGYAPVLWSLLGLVQVYPRCEPVTGWGDDEPLERYVAVAPFLPTGDKKPDNLGVLDGRTVWLDYDMSWNGCPHTAWVQRTINEREGLSMTETDPTVIQRIAALLDRHHFAGERDPHSFTGCVDDDWGFAGATEHDFNLHVAEALQAAGVARRLPEGQTERLMAGDGDE